MWCPDWPEETADRHDARAFERVITAVADFCPVVEVVRPGLCVLNARGPARYFGGDRRWPEPSVEGHRFRRGAPQE